MRLRAAATAGVDDGSLFLRRVGPNILPERLNLFVAEHALPRRHLVLAVAHRVVEARTIVGGQSAQVEYLAGANQSVAVADLAIVAVDILAGLDLGLLLRRLF